MTQQQVLGGRLLQTNPEGSGLAPRLVHLNRIATLNLEI